jgi:hypothetical protein
MIFNRNRVHFPRLRGLFARGRGNEGSSSAQGEAEQNDGDFQCQRHEAGSVFAFTPELLLIGANK